MYIQQIVQLFETQCTCAVSLWNMFENRQIAVIEGKCLRFHNSSECTQAKKAFAFCKPEPYYASLKCIRKV